MNTHGAPPKLADQPKGLQVEQQVQITLAAFRMIFFFKHSQQQNVFGRGTVIQKPVHKPTKITSLEILPGVLRSFAATRLPVVEYFLL
jgi:hypothetical protein